MATDDEKTLRAKLQVLAFSLAAEAKKHMMKDIPVDDQVLYLEL